LQKKIKSILLITTLTMVSLNADQQGFDKIMELQGVSFHVQATDKGSLNQLTITPSGLTEVNEVVKYDIDGSVVDTKVADLNSDGFPEVYVFISSAGSGAYGSLVAYSSNHNKSMTPIYLSELEDDANNVKGYMGHDLFYIDKSTLNREFPIYKKDDTNANPTGGIRKLKYKLKADESSWQLKPVK